MKAHGQENAHNISKKNYGSFMATGLTVKNESGWGTFCTVSSIKQLHADILCLLYNPQSI